MSCTMGSCCWLFPTNPTFHLVGQSGLLWPFLPHWKQVETNGLCSLCFCPWFAAPEDYWNVGLVFFLWDLHPGEVRVLECYPIYPLCVVRWPSLYRYLDWKGLLCLVAWCSSKMLATSRSDLGILFRTYSESPVEHNDKNLSILNVRIHSATVVQSSPRRFPILSTRRTASCHVSAIPL